METKITITLFCDEEGYIVKVTDAEGKRLDEEVNLPCETESCLTRNVSTFELGNSKTYGMIVNGHLTCGPGLR